MSFAKQKKRKIFALRKIIVQGKTRQVSKIQEKKKKIDRLAKYIYYIEISLNTSLFKESIPKQQRKKNMFIENMFRNVCNEREINLQSTSTYYTTKQLYNHDICCVGVMYSGE